MPKLYEPCTACDEHGKIHGVNSFGIFMEAECSCKGAKFQETGLTVAQVDRLVKADLARKGDPTYEATPDMIEAARLKAELDGLYELMICEATIPIYEAGQRSGFRVNIDSEWFPTHEQAVEHIKGLVEAKAKGGNG